MKKIFGLALVLALTTVGAWGQDNRMQANFEQWKAAHPATATGEFFYCAVESVQLDAKTAEFRLAVASRFKGLDIKIQPLQTIHQADGTTIYAEISSAARVRSTAPGSPETPATEQFASPIITCLVDEVADAARVTVSDVETGAQQQIIVPLSKVRQEALMVALPR